MVNPRTTPYASAEEALRDVRPGWHSRAGRHWADLLVVLGALLLLARFAFVALGALRPVPEPPARPELAGRSALPLQLAPGGAPDSPRAGMAGTLVLSPASAGAPALVLERIPVLATDEDRVIVAVTRAQLDSLAPRLGTSRAYLVSPLNATEAQR